MKIIMSKENVITAYKETGMQPIKGRFIKDNGCCPIAVLLIQKYGLEKMRYYFIELSECRYIKFKLVLESQFENLKLCSFLKGYEGRDSKNKNKMYELGLQLSRRIV